MTDYVNAYQTYLADEKHVSANTLSSYVRDITQFQTWLLHKGAPDLRKVKKETISEYLQYLTQIGKSPATVTRCTASVKSLQSTSRGHPGRYSGAFSMAVRIFYAVAPLR